MSYQTVQGGNGIKTINQKPRQLPYQHQRQPSPQPVVVRHVFTSGGQGIPVTMAVLPQATTMSPEVGSECLHNDKYQFLGEMIIFVNRKRQG